MVNKDKDDYIYNNVVVDCYDEYEQKSSWYHYLQDELDFPFIAYLPVEGIEEKANVRIFVKINVIGLVDESMIDNYYDIMVRAIYNEYIMKFPLSEIQDVRASNESNDAIELWKYWIAKR